MSECDRRQVLKAALGILIASPIIGTRAAVATSRASPSRPLVICDSQYGASVAFAHQAAQLGAPVRVIRSDITRLWQEELIPLWRSGSAIQMGMTGYDALFCLSMISSDWGMRPVYRMHHRPQVDGTLVHEGIGHLVPKSLALSGSTNWAQHNAKLLIDRARQPFDAGDAAACRREAGQSAGLCRDSLVSWILAPIGRPTVMASQMLRGTS